MRKVLKYILILITILFFKILLTSILNLIIVFNYHNGVYNQNLIKVMYILNFNEPYIAYYNDGNIAYNLGKYDKAGEKYDKALNANPPKKRVCDIRVNLSLANINQIDFNDKAEAIFALEDIKDILYEDDCIDIDEKSSQLEEEIDELINQLKEDKRQKNNNTNSNNNNNNSNDKYENVQKQLQESRKNSNKERQSKLETYERIGNYKYYSGKRW